MRPPLRLPLRLLLVVGAAAGAVCLSAVIPERATPTAPARGLLSDDALSTPSPYGRLTSARWAYGGTWVREDLSPVPNTNPFPEPQPHRDRPFDVAFAPDGRHLYVSLRGTEAVPGHEVALMDVAARRVLKRLRVGSYPTRLVAHPDGRWLVVLNQLSNYASVIDLKRAEVVSEVALDFYCRDLVFDRGGRRAFVSNRYLDQVLVLEVEAGEAGLIARVRPLPGLSDRPFLDPPQGSANLHRVLVDSCGAVGCHERPRGGFYAGEDPLRCYLSAIEHAAPGDPDESLLLRAVRPTAEGGFADDRSGPRFHAGGRPVWTRAHPGYQAAAAWIRAARPGPGIPVGNFGSKPGPLALSADGRRLYVGHQGTPDIAIVDVERLEEVSGVYAQNLITGLTTWHDPVGGRELLLAVSMGLGFGAAKERDPLGGETLDPTNPAAQYSLHRDVETTEPLPLAQQRLLGPFDAVDGTAAIKMSDIQNDLLAVDAASLVPPPRDAAGHLVYALRANRYEAHRDWVRYTSDSAEVLPQDLAGDIPPDLQRVVGAFPEQIVAAGDRAYVVMSGSSELVEWRIHAQPVEASDLLEPVAVYATGLRPSRVAVGPAGTPAAGLLAVANALGETVSLIDTRGGESVEVGVGDLARPFPDSDAERGEVFVTTNLFSVDGDTACVSCHIYGLSDGRGWGAGQAIGQLADGTFVNGGQLGIPALRNLFAVQPFYFEGTHTAYDAQLDDAREHMALQGFLRPNPHGDFTALRHPQPPEERLPEHEEIQDKMSAAPYGPLYLDLVERRDELVRQLSMRHFGKAYAFRDLQRFIGEYQAAETRLLPNPFDRRSPSVARGRLLFGNIAVGCAVCHAPPSFTNKGLALTNNAERTLPPQVSFSPREQAFTLVGPHWMDTVNGYARDLEPWEQGRVERQEGHTTTFALRGLFDRPFAFLHHGRALSLRESFATPDHYALRRFTYVPLTGDEVARPSGRERGFNERGLLPEHAYLLDTHGSTSQLTARQVQDLENFLLSIE